MKTKLLLAFLFAAAPSALAVDLFWDSTPSTPNGASDGGTGTWDTSTSNWDNGATYQTWNNGANDTAVFAGTSGTVTLGANINVSGLEFTSGGYTIAGGGNTITLGNNGGIRSTNTPGPSLYTSTGTTTINANINNNGFLFTTVGGGAAILNGVISGNGGFSTYNNSNVTLSGANTYTGKTSITSDTTGGSSLTVSSFNSVVGGTSSSSLGAPTTVANGTIDISTGAKRASCTLVYTGAGETTDRVIKVNFNSSSTQTINASGTGLLRFTSAMTTNANGGHTGSLRLGGSGQGEISQLATLLNTGGLDKRDAGTWTIGGTSNVSRLTVTAGALVNNGSFNVTTSVTVNNGTTLTAGYITAASMSLGATSNLLMDLGGTTLGTEYDNITIAGAMAYGGNLIIDNTGAYDMDDASQVYDLFALNGGAATGNFAAVTVNGISLTNSSGTWTGVNGDASYSFSQSSGDLAVTVIPEPSVAILGSLGLLCLLRRRR